MYIAIEKGRSTYVRDRVGRFAAVQGGPAGETGLLAREGAMLRDPEVRAKAAEIRSTAPTQLERENATWIAHAEVEAGRSLAHGDSASTHKHADGTYTAERQKVHETIITEWAREHDDIPSGLEQPTVIFMGGLPGSGKSSATKDLDFSDKVVVNSDAFKTGVDESTGKRWSKIPEYNGKNASFVHEESADLSERALGVARMRRQNVVFDATMGTLGKGGSYEDASGDGGVARKIKDFKDAGYRVEVQFVDVSIDTSANRAVGRYLKAEKKDGSGRYVPPGYIRALGDAEFGSRPRRTFEKVKHVVDAYRIIDNNGSTPKVLATRGKLSKRDRPLAKSGPLTVSEVFERAEEPRSAEFHDQSDALARQVIANLKRGTKK